MSKLIPTYKPEDKYTRLAAIRPPGGEIPLTFGIPTELEELESTHYLVYLINDGELIDCRATEELIIAQWLAYEFLFNHTNKKTSEVH